MALQATPMWRTRVFTNPRMPALPFNWHSPLTTLTALTFRGVFHLTPRQAEGLIGSIIYLVEHGLALAVPDHITLSRRAETLEAAHLRVRSGSEPMHLLVDSTGL